jgi:hypothetical protein
MNIARIAGIALMAGLALFLISVLAKVLIVGGLVLFGLRAIGRQIGRRLYGYGPMGMGPGHWGNSYPISIDSLGGHGLAYGNTAYRPTYVRANQFGQAMNEGIIPIN